MRRNVTEAELEVLKVLWKEGQATIRALTDRLYPGGGTAHYATVQKLLERLQGKGCVRRSPQGGRAHVYRATVDRPGLIARRLREMADQLCEGSMAPLLTQLVEARRLDAAELAELKALVDRLTHDRGSGE